MIEFVIHFFSKPVKILVLITFVYCLISLNRKEVGYNWLLLILFISLLLEITNSILKTNGLTTNTSTTVGTIFHNTAWLSLLGTFVVFKRIFSFFFISFIVFALCNFLLYEGITHFNYFTFITGAFIYIIIFVYESFYQLRKENFPFFLSNDYLLLSAPVIFFFGLSFMFGFKSKEVTSNIVFWEIKLYDLIIYFVNIIYYSLINIYIYREKKLANA